MDLPLLFFPLLPFPSLPFASLLPALASPRLPSPSHGVLSWTQPFLTCQPDVEKRLEVWSYEQETRAVAQLQTHTAREVKESQRIFKQTHQPIHRIIKDALRSSGEGGAPAGRRPSRSAGRQRAHGEEGKGAAGQGRSSSSSCPRQRQRQQAGKHQAGAAGPRRRVSHGLQLQSLWRIPAAALG